ncbi:hypothetical protein LINPERHAP2_LOCUS41913, partial [Linum perenne]
ICKIFNFLNQVANGINF